MNIKQYKTTVKNLTDKGNPSVLLLIIVEKKRVNFYLIKIRKVIFALDLKINGLKPQGKP